MTTGEIHNRHVKETLFANHRNTVVPMMLVDIRKATLQAIHTDAVNNPENNIMLDGIPHPIND